MKDFVIMGLLTVTAVLQIAVITKPNAMAPTKQYSLDFQRSEGSEEIIRWLNKMADNGWEAVTCRRASDSGSFGYECVFKKDR